MHSWVNHDRDVDRHHSTLVFERQTISFFASAHVDFHLEYYLNNDLNDSNDLYRKNDVLVLRNLPDDEMKNIHWISCWWNGVFRDRITLILWMSQVNRFTNVRKNTQTFVRYVFIFKFSNFLLTMMYIESAFRCCTNYYTVTRNCD